MRTKLTFALAASAAFVAAPATAATFLTVETSSPAICAISEPTCNFTITGMVDTSGEFTITSNDFSLPTSGILAGRVNNTSTSSTNIDFTGVSLTNRSTGQSFMGTVDNGMFDVAQFGPNNVASGLFALTLRGNALTGASSPTIGGTASFEAVSAAVPEPGTWAMMLLGFGAIGFAMRRRKDNGGQRVRVSYA